MGNIEIQLVEKYRYLGVILDEFLHYNVIADTLCNSASRALGAINSKIRNLKECNYKTYSDLFARGVSPITQYASSVWGYKQNGKCKISKIEL